MYVYMAKMITVNAYVGLVLISAIQQALLIVCDWELAEARKKDALDRARVRGEEPPAELLAEERGLHSSIETDVRNLLEGKSYGELEALQSQIESQMRSGSAKVVEYWEAILKRLHIYKAKVLIIKFFNAYVSFFKTTVLFLTGRLLQTGFFEGNPRENVAPVLASP